METIEREELKAELDAGTELKLVMAMRQTRFDQVHVRHYPGGLQQ